MDTSDAYYPGNAAWLAGQPHHRNPHPAHKPERLLWYAGWDAAEAEEQSDGCAI